MGVAKTYFLIAIFFVSLMSLFYYLAIPGIGNVKIFPKIDKADVLKLPEDKDAAPKEEKGDSSAVVLKPPDPLPVHSGKQVTVPILTYHFIGNNPNPEDKARDNLSVTPEEFEKQMEYLNQEGYKTMVLDTLFAVLYGKDTLPSKPVILTFDDGYVDFYFNAYPILKKYNFGAVVFLPTGLIGTSYYLNWGQVKEMAKSGIISFQSHSINHADLTTLSLTDAEQEIRDSKRVLEDKLGIPVNAFAYPYGMSSEDVRKLVQGAGYAGAVGTWESNVVSEGVIYNMPRIKIPGEMDIELFKTKLQV